MTGRRRQVVAGAADQPPGWLRRLAVAAGRATAEDFVRYAPAGRVGRRSAVLILFGEGPDGPDLLLIERSRDLRSHPGQPAFPGGRIDPADDGPVAAALREAHEETGLDTSGVQVLGQLPPLWLPPTGFQVVPVLAWWRRPSPVRPGDAAEVAAVARVPVRELADPANRLRIRHPSGFVGPAFAVRDMLVWGFTGQLVDRLVALGGWELPWPDAPVQDLPAETRALADRDRRPAGR